MAIQLGSAYAKVGMDISGLLTAVKQGKAGLLMLAQAGETLGEGLKNAGRTLTLGLTVPIAAVGAASIKAASDFEETKNKAVVVFGEMADSVVANANKAALSLGISKTNYLDYASSIAGALKAGGMGVTESSALAEQAVKHFSDLASFHNARVEDVAVAWQSAIRGQYEPIQRYFPFITDAYMKTYGIANGLVDANTKTLTANQRAVILNAIALDEQLNPALNDFSETAGGLANQGRIMKAQWQDALVMLGQNLLPIALQLVTALNKMLTAFNNLTPVQQKMVIGFFGILAILGPLLTLLGTVVSTISTLAGFAGTLSGLGVSFAGLSAGAAGLGASLAAVGAVLAPILLILAAIAVQVGLLYLAWKFNFLGMRDNVTMWVKVIKNLWGALTAFLRGDTDAALEHIGAAFEAIRERIAKVFTGFETFVSNWNIFLNSLKNGITAALTYISKAFTNVNWGTVGRYILLGIANGMLLGLPSLLTVALRVAQSVLATIKRSLGISSPSKEAMKLGVFTAQGFQLGLNRISPDEMARSLVKPITNATSNQQAITMNFASGVSIQQVRGMLAENNEQLMGMIAGALS